MDTFCLSNGSFELQKIVADYPEIIDIFDNISKDTPNILENIYTFHCMEVIEIITQRVFIPILIRCGLIREGNSKSGFVAMYCSILIDSAVPSDIRMQSAIKRLKTMGHMITDGQYEAVVISYHNDQAQDFQACLSDLMLKKVGRRLSWVVVAH